jgi:F0F1-type ATP synthase gamma subunit
MIADHTEIEAKALADQIVADTTAAEGDDAVKIIVFGINHFHILKSAKAHAKEGKKLETWINAHDDIMVLLSAIAKIFELGEEKSDQNLAKIIRQSIKEVKAGKLDRLAAFANNLKNTGYA